MGWLVEAQPDTNPIRASSAAGAPPNSGELLGFMTDRFDIVAVGIEHECAIVMLMIMRTYSWGSIVAAADAQRRLIEFIDHAARRCRERDVQPCDRLPAVTDPEKSMAVGAESGMRAKTGLLRCHFHHQHNRQRCQRRGVEALRALEFADGQTDVIEHGYLNGRLKPIF